MAEQDMLIDTDEEPNLPEDHGIRPKFVVASSLFIGFLVATFWAYSRNTNATDRLFILTSEEAMSLAAVNAGKYSSEIISCGYPESFEWNSISSFEPLSKMVADKALGLVNAVRSRCLYGSIGPLPFRGQDFQKGRFHDTFMHIQHKYASTCQGETFKIHFYVGYTKDTSQQDTRFVVEVFHDLKTDAWSLLRSSPQSCRISLGVAGMPEELQTSGRLARTAAAYAVSELSVVLKEANCLGATDNLELADVKSAHAKVVVGYRIKLVLKIRVTVEGSDPVDKVSLLWVLERCDLPQRRGETGCPKQLLLPNKFGPSVCGALRDPTDAVVKGLLGQYSRGHFLADATEKHVAQQDYFIHGSSRRLASELAPMTTRFISSGSVPASYDPRSHNCYQQVVPYDQGQCGSCYANAVAAMMGIRKCLADNGGQPRLRRLAVSEDDLANTSGVARKLQAVVKTEGGCTCMPGPWSYKGFKSDTTCGNPGNSAKRPWCYTTDFCNFFDWDYCSMSSNPLPTPPSPSPSPPAPPVPAPGTTKPPQTCSDVPNWKSPSGYNCAAWAGVCKKYLNEGQLHNCQLTCNTCGQYNADGTKVNPWVSAAYNYMPSVNDMVTCARDSSGVRGCNGGNVEVIWDNWMRSSSRSVFNHGPTCMPYSLKCFSAVPGSVVNPLTNSKCNDYKNYNTFEKPCSCIPGSATPTQLPSCSATEPASQCAVPAAVAMFTIATITHGLTPANAVLNLQRHIIEYGPVYMSFDTTSEFMNWDWTSNPVYTGGKKTIGGHAVVGIGWGNYNGIDFWSLRNSWGSEYADSGYFKFKRGVNLDSIESDGAAAMPASGFKDWSAPLCDLTSWSTRWVTDSSGEILKSYAASLKVLCSEDAALSTFACKGKASSAFATTDCQTFTSSAKAGDPVIVEVDLVKGGYGLSEATMFLHFAGTDSIGNVGSEDRSLTVAAVKGNGWAAKQYAR